MGFRQITELVQSALEQAFACELTGADGIDGFFCLVIEVRVCCGVYEGQDTVELVGFKDLVHDQGIFPAVATYSTDLHSLGQFMQQGRRNLLETIVRFERMPGQEYTVPADQGQTTPAAATGSSDWLAGKSLKEVNRAAETATITAHQAGHLAVAQITLVDFSAASLGALLYYFEVACAVSALLAGVNPFDQPGVEAYKQDMFRLLGRDGQQGAQ